VLGKRGKERGVKPSRKGGDGDLGNEKEVTSAREETVRRDRDKAISGGQREK